jgi:hypothetical protein
MTHHRQPGTAGRLARASSRAFVTRGVLQSRDERHELDLLWAASHANEPPAFTGVRSGFELTTTTP